MVNQEIAIAISAAFFGIMSGFSPVNSHPRRRLSAMDKGLSQRGLSVTRSALPVKSRLSSLGAVRTSVRCAPIAPLRRASIIAGTCSGAPVTSASTCRPDWRLCRRHSSRPTAAPLRHRRGCCHGGSRSFGLSQRHLLRCGRAGVDG